MGSISINSTFNFAFICAREETITGKPIDFTPEVKDEVIRDAVSHKLDRPLVNQSDKLCRNSTQTKTPTSPFKIGDSI